MRVDVELAVFFSDGRSRVHSSSRCVYVSVSESDRSVFVVVDGCSSSGLPFSSAMMDNTVLQERVRPPARPCPWIATSQLLGSSVQVRRVHVHCAKRTSTRLADGELPRGSITAIATDTRGRGDHRGVLTRILSARARGHARYLATPNRFPSCRDWACSPIESRTWFCMRVRVWYHICGRPSRAVLVASRPPRRELDSIGIAQVASHGISASPRLREAALPGRTPMLGPRGSIVPYALISSASSWDCPPRVTGYHSSREGLPRRPTIGRDGNYSG